MRIVITGIGLLSSLGIGASSVFEHMLAGEASKSGEIPGFDARTFLGDRGLRHFDRTALVLASAARLAAEQSGLEKAGYGPEEIGVVVGSTHGSIQAITEFDQEAVREGPNYVNPQDFANTVISQPASRVSVIFNATGLNTTIATGGASAIDALAYGMTMLRLGRVSTLLCGSAQRTYYELDRSYATAGKLVISKMGLDRLPQAVTCWARAAQSGSRERRELAVATSAAWSVSGVPFRQRRCRYGASDEGSSPAGGADTRSVSCDLLRLGQLTEL
jgi:hypothetical protein